MVKMSCATWRVLTCLSSQGVAGPNSVTSVGGREGVRSGSKCLTVLRGFELLRCSSNAPSAVLCPREVKHLISGPGMVKKVIDLTLEFLLPAM